MDTKLNIYTPGIGIFGTHVTWSDIEESMQDAFNTKVAFGRERSVKDIGDGNGFLSKICLINPDWEDDSQNLPKQFVAKICTALTIIKFSNTFSESTGTDSLMELAPENMNAFEETVWTAHNNEASVYELMEKYEANVLRCKVYYSKKFSKENPGKGYLLMEYKEDAKSFHLHNNVSPEDLSDAIRGVAALNALTVKMTNEEKSLFKTDLIAMFSHLKNEETMIKTTRLAIPEENQLIDRLEQIYYTINDPSYFDSISDKLGMEKVLVHGDLWNANLLWKSQSQSKLTVAAFIDFQTVSMSCSAGDLLRLFMTNPSGKDRLRHTECLLKQFYDFLLEELHGAPVPYTFEQLKESYYLFFPIAAYMVIPILSNFDHLLLPRLKEEEREPARRSCLEKWKILTTELVEYYEKKKNAGNFIKL